MNLDLPFDDAQPSDLEEYVKEIDRALDRGFMADLESAFASAAAALGATDQLPALAAS